jgi:hypothetical protein
MEENGSAIAKRLRLARGAAGYRTAADFAHTHDLEESTYRHHENGIRTPKIPTVERYAGLMGVSAAWILTGEGSGRREPAWDRSRERDHELPPPPPSKPSPLNKGRVRKALDRAEAVTPRFGFDRDVNTKTEVTYRFYLEMERTGKDTISDEVADRIVRAVLRGARASRE